MAKNKSLENKLSHDKDLKKIYEETVKPEHKSIVDKLLSMEEGDEINDSIRPRPPYEVGSVDEMMFPIHEKAKELALQVLKGHGYIYVLEGGARGGKDVFALLVWTLYLMMTPHKTHLALGKSLEHALLTILHSSGFGLYYTIPNGVFVRNSDSGAQRGIYKFKDMYGVEKEILFYGNDKKNDGEKYQGFTIGSTYVNEGMTQHLDGINQAIQRMASSHNHVMLVTQNPKGQAHPFYTVFEKDRIMSLQEIEEIEYIRDTYKYEYYDAEKELENEKQKDMKDFVKKFCKLKNVPKPDYLDDEDSKTLYVSLRNIDVHYDKQIAALPVERFAPKVKDGHFLWKRSMRKIVNFDRGGKNPNNVLNAYDYTYSHFTVDDNLGLTDMQREEFKRVFKKGSALYLQKSLGIRKTAERAVYKEFSYKNLFDDDIELFDKRDTMRVIAIDVGFNHETGILDAEVDFNTGVLYVLQERLLDYKNQGGTIQDIENVFWELVRSRKKRQMPQMVIIDPSHVATINHFLDKGIDVTPANNSSIMPRSKDKMRGNLNPQKDILGIDLVKYGFDIQKIMIHDSCINTIAQIESNEFEYNENTGKLAIKKINDDLLDPLRYIVNTVFGGTHYWENEGGEIIGQENVSETVSLDDGTQKEAGQALYERIQKELNRGQSQDIFGEYDELDRSNGLLDERQDGLWFLGKSGF
jgi:hypothetical protein